MSDRITVYLSLGSNLGNREEHLFEARQLVAEKAGELVRISGLYETAPWGFESRNPFFNCCLSVVTSLEPMPLMDVLLGIEKKLGRSRSNQGYSDRLIDIDVLFYGDRTYTLPGLTVPHPSMAQRRFVLTPLAEIAPEMVNPVSGITVREMLERCDDPSPVRWVANQTRWNSNPSQNI